MCTLRRPFIGESLPEVFNNILNMRYEPLDTKFKPIFHELIRMLLNKDEKERSSVGDVLAMEAL